MSKKTKATYKVNCYECGQPTEINFKPDGIRPIYCQTCFQKIREGLLRGQESNVKMEEVKTEETPAISLSEALKKPPQEFEPRGGNQRQTDRPALPQAPENEPEKETIDYEPEAELTLDTNKNPAIEEIVRGSLTLGSQQLEDNEAPKKVSPGQVVKF